MIVVDMQNDFASEDGAFVRAGLDVTPIPAGRRQWAGGRAADHAGGGVAMGRADHLPLV